MVPYLPLPVLPLPQIWKGTQKASEHPLLDTPVAICSYISENAAPRLPALAVAAGGPCAIEAYGLGPEAYGRASGLQVGSGRLGHPASRLPVRGGD